MFQKRREKKCFNYFIFDFTIQITYFQRDIQSVSIYLAIITANAVYIWLELEKLICKKFHQLFHVKNCIVKFPLVGICDWRA